MRTSVARLAVIIAAAVGAASSQAAASSRRCTPPLGPNDRSVHSRDLLVEGVGCASGRVVALACVRFTYGRSGTCEALGLRWRRTSTDPAGSTSSQRCVAGRRFVSIRWLD